MSEHARDRRRRLAARARTLVLLGAAGALVAAAGCGGSSSSSSSASGGTTDKTPVTIVLWHLFSGEEKKPFNDALAGFHKQYPWITIKQEVQPNTDNDTFDPNLINAIKGGNPPDVALPFGPDYIGQYCSSGLWQNLTPYMQRDHVSISEFAPAAITYTKYGSNQCALPSLTDAYGLYYNKAMFKKAGISGPPKTMTELMADAKKLTVKNPDGSIKVAGFVPLDNWEELGPADLARAWGGKWFNDQNQAQLSTDPAWASALMWQRQLVDWYGYSNIEKFFLANTNNEFNPTNAFETGKVAMMFDGEWRTAFIQRDNPKLDYGTAPFPAADPSVYGSGRVGGTVVGIPKGAKHPDQAWLLVKYLATDTNYLVTLANSAGNVPTTKASSSSPKLNLPPTFQTFIDVWNNPQSSFSPPLQPSGGGYNQFLSNFDDKWTAGSIPISGLHSGLEQVDQQIDNDLQQGQGP
jgi:multiple sugar transport system substrate-binding protein